MLFWLHSFVSAGVLLAGITVTALLGVVTVHPNSQLHQQVEQVEHQSDIVM